MTTVSELGDATRAAASNGVASAKVKAGGHREATLYRALAGAGAGDGRSLEQLRADAAAGSSRARETVGRGHIGVGAVVDVQQRALRSLEQQRVTATTRLLDSRGDVCNHRLQLRRERQRGIECLPIGHGSALVILRQHEVVILEQRLELGGEAVGVEDVLHAQRAPGYFVFVGWADAASGGAELGFPQ